MKKNRNKYGIILGLGLLAAVLCLTGCKGKKTEETMDQRQQILSGLEAWFSGGESGEGNAWLCLCRNMSGLGPENWQETYLEQCHKLLTEEKKQSATDLSLMLLGRRAAGSEPDAEEEVLITALLEKETVLKQGINGAVFALLALDAAGSREDAEEFRKAADAAQEEYLRYILDRQKEDGGFAFSGEYGDPDMTAMVLCSLAGRKDQQEAADAAEKAVEYLAAVQQEDGGFLSFGVRNSESCAQVLIALQSLGIDPKEDDRFLKNGKSPEDALLTFQKPDGGFGHTAETEESNAAASMQAYLALASLERGRSPYAFAGDDSEAVVETEGSEEEKKEESRSDHGEESEDGKEKKRTDAEICAEADAGIFGIGAGNASGRTGIQPLTEETSPDGQKQPVCSLTICCDSVLEHMEDLTEGKEALIPEDGILLSLEEEAFSEGESIFEILRRALKDRKMHFEYSDGNIYGSTYIEGIGNLYERDCGPLSGWIYRVNGETRSISASEYIPKDGDVIEWIYTCDLGKDIAQGES